MMNAETRPPWVEEMIDLYEIDQLLLIDNMGCAIVGVAERLGRWIAVYDEQAVIERLMHINEWDEETAEEYFGYNIANAWLGDGTPLIMQVHRSREV